MGSVVGVTPRHWWAFALRGVAAIAFGCLAFAWPGLTLQILVSLFGAFAFIDGMMSIVSAIRSRGEHLWGLLLEGALGVVAGIGVLSWPGITAVLLVYVIAAWAVVTGALEVYSAVRLRKVIQDEWAWIIGGVLSLGFGIAMIITPGAGALALVWLIGIYAVFFGITLLVLAWRLHKLGAEREHRGGQSVQRPAVP